MYAWMQGPPNPEDEGEQSEINKEDDLISYALAKADSSPSSGVQRVKVDEGKIVLVRDQLNEAQVQQAVEILRKHKVVFSQSYKYLKGIPPSFYRHHIYMKEDSFPICQPQRRLNPAKMQIVKEELEKLLDANFIYPI